jgi:hypothetical protein
MGARTQATLRARAAKASMATRQAGRVVRHEGRKEHRRLSRAGFRSPVVWSSAMYF